MGTLQLFSCKGQKFRKGHGLCQASHTTDTLTGDVKYHDAQAASELGLCVVDAGHFGTERLIVQTLAEFAHQHHQQ